MGRHSRSTLPALPAQQVGGTPPSPGHRACPSTRGSAGAPGVGVGVLCLQLGCWFCVCSGVRCSWGVGCWFGGNRAERGRQRGSVSDRGVFPPSVPGPRSELRPICDSGIHVVCAGCLVQLRCPLSVGRGCSPTSLRARGPLWGMRRTVPVTLATLSPSGVARVPVVSLQHLGGFDRHRRVVCVGNCWRVWVGVGVGVNDWGICIGDGSTCCHLLGRWGCRG